MRTIRLAQQCPFGRDPDVPIREEVISSSCNREAQAAWSANSPGPAQSFSRTASGKLLPLVVGCRHVIDHVVRVQGRCKTSRKFSRLLLSVLSNVANRSLPMWVQ